MKVGFVGLGVMGTPMALNLARRYPLTVWNRSSSKYPPLRQAGAQVAESPSLLARDTDVIFTMLHDQTAIQSIFTPEFRSGLRNKTLINTSSVPVEFSKYMADEIHRAGGRFIEMPVSGKRSGEMGPLVELITKAAVYCGEIGMGLKTKFAVNTYLITMTAGLAESMALARAQDLDIRAFTQVLDAGPMASPYSKLKLEKMIDEDWSAQASINDCFNLTQIIDSASTAINAESPMIRLAGLLYKRAIEKGFGKDDMIAVEKVLGLALEKDPA
ncbi:unnamed protein product [Parascedosporium putredinis]|uniref:Uncharacterized protein n=1 Tax=Parascedosporium putredinis TaxID=1442378 RepID=A0A9P1H318_9PEZI|nr:unnamed protein product [Parascedosporium putredinis]CAI7994136.1 unnamed protein product [Parascedosporium putredinis]